MTEALDPGDFAQIVEATWCILAGRALSAADIEERMRSADPFRSRWEETEKVIRALAEGRREEQ